MKLKHHIIPLIITQTATKAAAMEKLVIPMALLEDSRKMDNALQEHAALMKLLMEELNATAMMTM